MKRLIAVGLLLCVALIIASPQMVSYQGKITDADGIGVSGEYDIEFKIFDRATGGDLLASAIVSDVSVARGLFAVNFEVDLTIEELEDDLWLEIVFDSDPMLPRQLIASEIKAMYARNAGYAAVAGSVNWDDVIDVPENIGGDNLGDHIATRALNMAGWGIWNATRVEAMSLELSEKATSAETEDGDPDATLTTKSYVDNLVNTDIERVFYVAKNGNDDIADGSIQRPFLTISAAIDAATGASGIIIAPGTYTEDIEAAGVYLKGYGVENTIIDGDITINPGLHNEKSELNDLTMASGRTFTNNAQTNIENVLFRGSVHSTNDLMLRNCVLWVRSSYDPVLTISGGITYIHSTIIRDVIGGNLVINQTGGELLLNSCNIYGSRATEPIIISTGGRFVATTSYFYNLGGGLVANLDNGNMPFGNELSELRIYGNILCGDTRTITGSYHGTGQIIGTNLVGAIHGGTSFFPQKAQSFPTEPDDDDLTLVTKCYVDNLANTNIDGVFYVAKNGNDDTGDGSMQRPFLTISAAIDAAPENSGIVIAPGVYTEDIVAQAISIRGYGPEKTVIDGNVTLLSGVCDVSELEITSSGTFTSNARTTVENVLFNGSVVSSNDLMMTNCVLWEATGTAPAMTVTGGIAFLKSTIIYDAAGGENLVINQTGGELGLNTCIVTGNRAVEPLITSTGGRFTATTSYFYNIGGGLAANIDNGNMPFGNELTDMRIFGDVICGDTRTMTGSYHGIGQIIGTDLLGAIHGGIHFFPQKAQSAPTEPDDDPTTLVTKSYVDALMITTGVGEPSEAAPNGSLYIQTDDGGALFFRTNGAWRRVALEDD